MSDALPTSQLRLTSLVTPDGSIELTLVSAPVPTPAPGEVLVRVEAVPINPSDVGVLLARAEPASFEAVGSAEFPAVRGRVPDASSPALRARLGIPLTPGNEGSGVIVAVGDPAREEELLGRTVAMNPRQMYQQYRTVPIDTCIVVDEGTPPVEAASSYVNPMTVLGMIETMRREGHTALVHTAAASNLGQMLVRVCEAEGIGLVNVVRRPEQEALLRAEGAEWVVDSSQPDFEARLTDAIAATGATLGFDAIGGGEQVAQILSAMEVALTRDDTEFHPYGSAVHKQVYLYGMLDRSPTVIARDFGMAWGVGGWLLRHILDEVGPEVTQRMRARVVSELSTTFHSAYSEEISLGQMLQPEIIARFASSSTGGKLLVNPTLDSRD